MIIYKTTNLVNGKIYVGQDRNNNPDYYGSGKLLKRAISKYGKTNFKKEVLEECTSTTELDIQEVYWIEKLKSRNNQIGYNISEGGKEGDRKKGHDIVKTGIYNYWLEKYGKEEADKRREVQIEKIRNHLLENGSELTNKGRYKLWLDKYGKEEADRRYLEWKLKISEYQQYKLENGWKHTEEAKKKIREAVTGRVHSEKSKQKMRKPKPDGFGEKLSKIKKGVSTGRPSPNRKRIVQISIDGIDLKIWDSVNEAETKLKIYNISAVCKGKQETAGGYKWKYYEKWIR